MTGGEGTAPPVAAEQGRLSGGVFFRHWRPTTPQGVILLVHGLGEHSGRYQGFAQFFCARGFAVVAPDHPGHGHSPGRRAHIDRFATLLAPLEALRARIRLWYPGQPCFLVGHSMGGLIAARYLLDHQDQFTGAALSGAALAVAEPPSPPLLYLVRMLAALWPTAGAMQLDASQVSRDPAVVADYRADPLVHSGRVSARLVRELFAAMAEVAAGRAAITLPLLIMHGEADAMTAPGGSREFHDGVGALDKTLCIYPGLYHEIFNEPERLEVLQELADWCRQRLPSA